MSEKTFVPFEDQVDSPLFLANRGRLLDLDGNYSLSPSPDSDGCNFNLSDRRDSASTDINTLSTDGPMMHHCNTLPQGKLFTNLENAFIATPDSSSINFWNDNLSLLSNQESEGKNTFFKTTSEGSSSAVVSPDSVGMSSCRTSCRGSMDFSFSSGEMVVRSNSFCQEEQSPLVLSSLEESPAPPVTSHVDSKMLVAPLCEKDGTSDHTRGHPCFGMTFILGDEVELPREDDLAMSNSFLALPTEKEGLHSTFLCENSPGDCANEAQVFCSEAELLNESKPLATSAQGIFVSPVCAVQDSDKDIHTSTPVQNLGSYMPSLPTFAVSPCTENGSSPALRSVVRKKGSVTPNQVEKGSPTSGSKVTEMKSNKFPKSDFSSIKCKVISRAVALGSALFDKPSQMSTKHEAHKVGSVRPSPTRINNGTTPPVSTSVHNSQRRPNMGAKKDQKHLQNAQSLPSPTVSEEVQAKSTTLVTAPLNTDASKQAPASPDREQGASNKVNTHPKAHNANATFIYPEKSPQKSEKIIPKATPKKDVTSQIKKVKSGSALGQDKPTPNTRPRCNSESSTTLSRLLKIQRPMRFSTNFTPTETKTENRKSQNKPGNQYSSSQSKPGGTKEATENNCRKVKKIGLVALTAASCAENKARFCGQSSPNQTSRPSTSKSSAAGLLTATPLNKHRLGASGRESCRTNTAVGTPLPKQKNTGSRKGQATGETSSGPSPAASTKRSSSQHLQTPSRSSLMGPPPTPVSRLQQRKTFGPNKNQNEAGPQSETSNGARNTQVSGVAGRRATPFKAAILKARLSTTPAKTTGPVLTTPCKSAATTKGLPNGHISPQKKTNSSKLIRLSAPVDRNKPKAGSRPQQPQPQQQPERGTSRPHQSIGPQDVGPTGVAEGQRQDQRIQQLQAQLAQSNKRFDVFIVVMQQIQAQRDEAVQQCRGLSQELVDLRGELLTTVNKSECLEKEKDELRAALQDAVEKVQEQHQRDLLDLEQRLQESYQAEVSAAQQTYQDEAEKCKALMQQQIGELKASHEAMKQDREKSHAEQLLSVKLQYEHSLEELRNIHTQELQSLNKTLKDAEVVLSEKIQELTRENNALMEKLTEEETRRKELSQKDSHTVYLEQELESLKAVLDIRNKQLHQQEKKLMEVSKLTEKNVKLDESLRKVQQENEDLKARMERHAALSRQLSTEQAVLHESLQKESKVNKRLSMENEELLWKLHNGDLSSPRKTSPSPSSPSHFSLQSPRSPSLFSSPPVSPR